MDSPSNRLLEDTKSVCSRLAAHEGGAASTVAVVAALDDTELTGLLRDASRLRAETDALITTAAGVIAKRSERALGYAGLAQRAGHRTPTAMVQAITGTTHAEAARQVRLGEALGEADAAERIRAGEADGAEPGGAEPGSTPEATDAPWYEPVTSAVIAHVISAEAGAGILRGLGRPDRHCPTDALRAAAVGVLARADGVNVDELTKQARWARDAIDPVGVEERAAARYQARTWRFGRDKTTGAHTAWVIFDDESAAWVHSIIDTALAPRRGGPRFVAEDERAKAESLIRDPRSNDQLVFDLMMDTLHAGALADATRIFGVKQAESPWVWFRFF